MNKEEGLGEDRTSSSRFAYYGDEPTECGVTSVRTRREPGVAGSPQLRPALAGAPAPDERLLDISELARTVGMRYTHAFVFPMGAEGDLVTASPIVGTVTMTNTGAALLMTGTVSTTLQMECGRCLAPTEQPVSAELEEVFDLVTRNNAFNQEEVQAIDEDSPAAVIEGNVLNLADLLRQNLMLAAPLQPLCREDCPGIPYDPGASESEGALAKGPDNPLRHLAELLEARRPQE